MMDAPGNPEISILPARRDDLEAIMLLERPASRLLNSGVSEAGAASCSARAGRS